MGKHNGKQPASLKVRRKAIKLSKERRNSWSPEFVEKMARYDQTRREGQLKAQKKRDKVEWLQEQLAKQHRGKHFCRGAMKSKLAFNSEDKAERALQYVNQVKALVGGGNKMVSVYPCPECTDDYRIPTYHITSSLTHNGFRGSSTKGG